MNINDWRLTNQMNYLFKQKLIKGPFVPYRKGWDHEHCAFCSEEINKNSDDVFFTEDRYHYICYDCFKDFKDMFEWSF